MVLQTVETIYEEMRRQLSELTGMLPAEGGDLSLRLYAVATELYSLWEQAGFVLRQAFPQTAVGEYLDYHGEVRGIRRQAGNKSRGTLEFFVSMAGEQALTIPEGTVCADGAGNRFVTTQAGQIPVGQTRCRVQAQASQPGAAGNVPAGSITYMVVAPVGVEGCSNPSAFTDGRDRETDESLRARILSSYQKLPNGANVAYYETQALNTEGVAAVQVLPRNRGVGTVDVVIATESGQPSEELIGGVQNKLAEQREICVDLKVLAPVQKTVDVAVQVTVDGNYDGTAVCKAVEEQLRGWFTGQRLGQAVFLAQLGNVIYGVEGVVNYAISRPQTDLSAEKGTLPVLGTLSVTQQGA